MIKLKLTARTESAGTDKIQLQFADVTSGDEMMPMAFASGVNLSGYVSKEYAATLDVGQVYSLELIPVE